jgi:hypothetical protein
VRPIEQQHEVQAPFGSKWLTIVLGCLLVMSVVGWVVPAARAETTHAFLKTITEVPASSGAASTGPFFQPQAITVDSGHLYVADGGNENGRVDIFDDTTGAWLSQFEATPSLSFLREGIALGHSTGETETYVGADESGSGRIAVFNAAGHLQGTWDGSDTPAKEFGCFECNGPGDVAVDTSTSFSDPDAGDVYVSVPGQSVVDVFRPLAGGKEQYVTQITEREGTPLSEVFGVAVSPLNGDVIVLDANGVDIFEPALGSYTLVRRITETPKLGAFHELHTGAVVVDSTGEIYVADRGPRTVAQFDSEGNFLGAIQGSPAGPFGNTLGSLAVDPVSHDVFVGDRQGEFGAEREPVDVFGPDIILPDVVTGAATGVTPTEATLNGTVNPDEAGAATCRFVWGTSSSFGKTAACSEAVPDGNTPVAVHATLTGLEPDTSYSFRLQASNANGTNPGEGSVTFTTPGAGVHAASVTEVTADSASFEASIDPNNTPTTVHFQYGTTSSYGSTTPAEDIGSGKGDVTVGPSHVQGLQAGTVYHYRVVALSELSPGVFREFAGADQTFTTQAAGTNTGLLDGRHWEMVSPPNKEDAKIEPIDEASVVQAAARGNAISYLGNAPIEPEPAGSSNQVQILSTRGSGGWNSQNIALPHEATTGATTSEGQDYRAFSTELSSSVVQPIGPFTASLSAAASEQTAYLHDLRTGISTPLVTGCPEAGLPCPPEVEAHANVPRGTVIGGTGAECHTAGFRLCSPRFMGATPDLSHLLLESDVGLAEGVSGPGLYEWAEGALTFVGGIFHRNNAFQAVSDDGSRVVFNGASEGLEGLLVRDGAREETVRLGGVGSVFQFMSSDGSRVLYTSGGDLEECALVVPPGGKLECDVTDLTPGGGVVGRILGASGDGSWVYFAANSVLAPGGTTGDCPEADVEPTSEACGLYVAHGGVTGFVGALSGNDARDWQPNLRQHPARVSPDGQWIAFMSQEPLTGYDNQDASSNELDEEVFEYHAGAGTLVCASCDPTGARPSGVEYVHLNTANGGITGGDAIWREHQWIAGNVPGWTPYESVGALYQSRYLSDSGRLFFNSSVGLVPGDVNGNEDVYELEPAGAGGCTSPSSTGYIVADNGCLGLVSSGVAAGESAFLDASESGEDVFFLTSGRLSKADVDSGRDVYDAHECSGSSPCFPEVVAVPPACETGDSCKPAPSPQPSIFGSPSSSTFSGAGNVVPTVSKAAKPKAKPLTRVQKLARALAACHREARSRRVKCQKVARKRFGPVKKSRKKR